MFLPKRYHGYKVIPKDSRSLKDYAGMNYFAAKALGFHNGPKPKEIWIDTRSFKHHPKVIKKNLVHEYVEAEMMKKHHCYWCSHKMALKAEKRI